MNELIQTEQQESSSYMMDLQLQTQKLLQCQADQGMESCFNCSQLLECKMREAYVNAVYESLNQGQQTDFDF